VTDEEKVAKDFVERWSLGPDEMVYHSFREFFTPDTHWDNVGIRVTKGIDEAIGLMEGYRDATGTDSVKVDILNLMSTGSTVIMERLDRMLDRNGREFLVLPAVGVFGIEGGKIAWWRDYFDSAYMDKAGVDLPVS